MILRRNKSNYLPQFILPTTQMKPTEQYRELGLHRKTAKIKRKTSIDSYGPLVRIQIYIYFVHICPKIVNDTAIYKNTMPHNY